MTSSFRHGVTITGTVLLVAGTLCFAWWSDGEMELLVSNSSRTTLERETQPAQMPSTALLRSVSFFCCGAGGLLLLFGLLWSVKENKHVMTQRYQYNLPRELHYVSREFSKKLADSNHGHRAVPTYEEAMSGRSAENIQLFPLAHTAKKEHLPPAYTAVTGSEWRHGRPKRSLSDSALQKTLQPEAERHTGPEDGMTTMLDTPPPSYESIPAHVT